MTDKEEAVMAGLAVLGIPVLITLIATLEVMVRAWAVMVLWNWFAVPLLGLPALGLLSAMGIALVAASFIYRTTAHKDHEVNLGATAINAVLGPAILVTVGWLVRLFV